VPPAKDAAAIGRNRAKVLGLVGGKDRLIGRDEWQRLDALLAEGHVDHQLVTYSEAKHGFFCEDRPQDYDVAASADAWLRLTAALSELSE
jgi:carboxymethylenebutenolidase